MFTNQDVMKLREKTGAGMMDCKKALQECDGNMDKAVDYLREKGIAKAAKKADRIAAEGVVESYIHLGGKIGVLVEVNCETDFVAKSDNFKALCKQIAMHIAAFAPKYVRREEVEADVVAKEKEMILLEMKNDPKNANKPEAILEKMVEGKIGKFYSEICLMEQAFAIDPSKTLTDVINEAILTIGEKITVRRFVRYEMGEGLEKRQDNFAAEVASQMQGC